MKIFSIFFVSFFLFYQKTIHQDNSSSVNKNPLNFNTQLLKRYQKYGKRIKISNNSVIYEYVKDSVHYKMLIEENKIVYSSSEHIYSDASGLAKFDNNCIVFYDTLDGRGEKLKLFIKGLPDYNNKEYLSSELIEFYCE